MSLANLAQPNSYEVYARSMHTPNMFVNFVNGIPYVPNPPAPGGTSFSVSKDGNQTVNTLASNTVIAPWQVNSQGDYTNLSFNSTTGVFTSPVDGKFVVSGQVLYEYVGAATAGNDPVLVCINGTPVKECIASTGGISAGIFVITITASLFLDSGDLLTIQIANQNESDMTILETLDSAAVSTYFSVHLIA